jgi:amino acid transporter
MASQSFASSGVPASSNISDNANIADKGLKKDAIGFLSNLVIGVASVAPAYSLAVTLGFITGIKGVGVHAPGIMIAAFVPMLLVAAAYKYLNRADPDCGTTFAWATRAMGPQFGWINGWAIFLADVLVMASLAEIASKYTYLLFGLTAASNSTLDLIIGAVVWIAVMTWICYRGIELSARIQQFLLSFEVIILAVFAIVALITVYASHPAGHMNVQLSWFNPFAGGFSALVDGVLLGVFIYWGWDSGVAVNEETRDKRNGPGLAAVLAPIVLLFIYVIVSTAAQAYHGTAFLTSNQNDILNALGKPVLGGGILGKLLIIAVLTSASASTQTTILPTARTTLSMAKWDAIPGVFGRLHPRYLTPTVSTIGMGVLSILWTVALLAFDPSQNVLSDSITALGFSIAFYYGFTGIACVVYFRRQITRSLREFLLMGVAPLLGGLMLLGIFGKAFHDYSKADSGYSPPLLGIQVPIVIGVGGLLFGVVLMFVAMPFQRDYFRRRPELPDANGLAPETIAPEDDAALAALAKG